MIGKTVRQGANRIAAAAGKAGIARLSVIAEKAWVFHIARYLGCFAGGWLLSEAVIFGAYAPFSVGFAAVAGGGMSGLAALIGVFIGSLIRGGTDAAIKYSAAVLLVFTANMVLKGTEISAKKWFAPIIAALMLACTGLIYVAHDGWQLQATVLCMMETVLAGGSAYFYSVALIPAESTWQERRRVISTGVVLCTVMIALSNIVVLDLISLGRVLAVVAVISAAYKGGPAAAAVAGIAFGTAMDAAEGSLPFFCASLGIAGVAAGLFAGSGRLVGAVAYIIANAAAVIWFGGGRLALASLYETFIASVAFVLLPERLLINLRENFAVRRNTYLGEEKAKAYARRKAELAAEAFSVAYGSLSAIGANRANKQENITTVFEAAADRKCVSCKERGRCHGSDYELTRTVQNDMTVRMKLRGELLPQDFPEYFKDKCKDLEGFCKVVNDEYTQLLRRRERNKKAGESYELVCGRFIDIAEVFTAFSQQLVPAGNLEREIEERMELYMRGKGVDASAAVFRDGNGRLHIEVDGDGAAALKKLPDWVDRLSAVIGKPICEMDSDGSRRHIVLLEAEPLAVRIGVASLRRSGEEVSGDKGAYFKTDSGLLYVILSDGMGSGEGAAEDSNEVISLLEKFLRAGIGAESAMRLVGATMQLKNDCALSTASVDLLCVNLFTGQADIFKFGAAPTFVKTSAGVSVLEGDSLSAGLRGDCENLPDHIATRLDAGSTAVIVSDGVTGGEDTEWLCLELGNETAPGREFARRVLEEAGRRTGCSDDMTVITVNVEKR